MSVNEKAPESSHKYNHRQICDDWDKLNRQLEEMKETILNTSVRAHLLEADLATLFDPRVADSLREAKQDCEKCTQSVYGVE